MRRRRRRKKESSDGVGRITSVVSRRIERGGLCALSFRSVIPYRRRNSREVVTVHLRLWGRRWSRERDLLSAPSRRERIADEIRRIVLHFGVRERSERLRALLVQSLSGRSESGCRGRRSGVREERGSVMIRSSRRRSRVLRISYPLSSWFSSCERAVVRGRRRASQGERRSGRNERCFLLRRFGWKLLEVAFVLSMNSTSEHLRK